MEGRRMMGLSANEQTLPGLYTNRIPALGWTPGNRCRTKCRLRVIIKRVNASTRLEYRTVSSPSLKLCHADFFCP